ncbi:MAG: DEAD/DEAH box helicase [Ferrimicrobium sp.]
MTLSFAELGVDESTLKYLANSGITVPTEIQVGCLPAAIEGRDVTGRAPTGSGKTLAFGIPMVMRLSQLERHNRPSGLVLAPTRELALQITEQLTALAQRNLWVNAVYGGTPYGPQLKAFHRGVDIVVATPGRLEDLLERRALTLDGVKIVVVDEIDRMADMGFAPALHRILGDLSPDRQTLFFSATLDASVESVVRRHQHDAIRVEIDTVEEDLNVEHRFVRVQRYDRADAAARLIEEHGSTIIFCNTRNQVERLDMDLTRAGVRAVSVHGGRSQRQRESAIRRFSTQQASALIATDVAARGIHVDNVALVVHYDLPDTFTDYLHRSGRTGRAGNAGVVVSLVGERDAFTANRFERQIAGGTGVDRPFQPADRSSKRRTSRYSSPRRGR